MYLICLCIYIFISFRMRMYPSISLSLSVDLLLVALILFHVGFFEALFASIGVLETLVGIIVPSMSAATYQDDWDYYHPNHSPPTILVSSWPSGFSPVNSRGWEKLHLRRFSLSRTGVTTIFSIPASS